MAEDVAAGSPAPKAAERPAASRAERERSSAYYTRFSLAYTLLAMLAVLAVGALVLILLRPSGARGPAWSSFKPSGSASEIERQIATRVGSEYRASTTQKLVSVFPGGGLATTRFVQTGSGQTSVRVPISLIAVQRDVSTGKHDVGDYTFFQPGSTVTYEMCGFGDTQQNCGVASQVGTNPTALLHREALELSLYTLKYLPNVRAVITYLPPPANPQAAAKAVLFARADVQPNLRLPLARTVKPQQVLLGVGVPNANHVAELSASHVFTSNYQTLPADGSAALVLTPTSAGR
ncbi:MAG TPA: hypothetical protein VFU30_04910 [Gaiellaceae bacterium]|nr:hypothetical protein [Gaiellaceae bacterium]